eukprot:1155952-Pelagomonas_calceolata.AAC.3
MRIAIHKFRPAVADALAKQAKSLDTDLTGFLGSQSFTPPDGAVEIAPLSKEETEVLQTALAGRQSFSLPAVQRPLNRLKGGSGTATRALSTPQRNRRLKNETTNVSVYNGKGVSCAPRPAQSLTRDITVIIAASIPADDRISPSTKNVGSQWLKTDPSTLEQQNVYQIIAAAAEADIATVKK